MSLSQAYIFSCLSLLAGLALSFLHNDWNWFSRTGSLVVIAGILLTSTEILAHLQVLRQRRQYGEGWSQHDWAQETDHQSRQSSNGDSPEHRHNHGFYLLIVGTLIWGFGDLLGIFFTR